MSPAKPAGSSPPTTSTTSRPWTANSKRSTSGSPRPSKTTGTSLTDVVGVGPVTAALILGEVGNVARFPSKDHFASYTGTAPLEASSGDVVRHRLSRAGNRRLNHALHIAALSQKRYDDRGRAYYARNSPPAKATKAPCAA